MNANTFQQQTRKTWNLAEEFDRRVMNACLGIAGETGEVLELIKKDSFHGKPLDKDNLKKEIGDVLYYVARLADEYGLQLEDIMDANIRKLQERYPDGFKQGGGIR